MEGTLLYAALAAAAVVALAATILVFVRHPAAGLSAIAGAGVIATAFGLFGAIDMAKGAMMVVAMLVIALVIAAAITRAITK